MVYSLGDFGSYWAGGSVARVSEGAPRDIAFTRDASYRYDPRGDFAINAAYVQYFVPMAARGAPVVLVHGGGMAGSCWETTPDGRPGWLHRLLDAGRAVHVVDLPERGRAGFAPAHMPGAPILRSLQEAWSLFRFGPEDGFDARAAYAAQQFPVEALEAFGRRFVPRWLGTAPVHLAALLAVLARTGPAVVICHSQGSETVFDAAALRPDLVVGLVAVEPSAFPADPATLATCPPVIVQGDHLDCSDEWRARAVRWSELASAVPGAQLIDTAHAVAPGGSHMLMMDRHSDGVLDAALAALRV
ncbi:alpha/beta fold hydrolase [Roseovarius nanhaiticus]|uniref:alpha/beta fold hydrolase n=1 Tax=Roseovarius nanhaiticus TaxID=573024 RepID=UPI0024912383|nr:alpha/beta fold hydrolase [Roseovarius nanhaiticus]